MQSRSLDAARGNKPARRSALPLGRHLLGCVLLLAAAALSAVLASQRLGALELPGCGVESACGRAARSAWAVLPGTSWPLAFVGLAYFLGLFALFAGAARGVPSVILFVVRIGAAGSAWLLIVLLSTSLPCGYCIAVQLLHLSFWVLIERAPRSARLPRAAGILAGLVVLVTSLLLGLQLVAREQVLLRRGEIDLTESTQEIMRAMLERNRVPVGFRGRYLLGPERAAVRIVLFTDYQCEECQRIDPEVQALVERHESVSLSIKHFPFCSECNPAVTGPAHQNACWAARAAETAGLLFGPAGFFAMHGWLMRTAGGFETEYELEAGIEGLGFDPEGFVETMTSERTLQLVEADVQEALDHGLYQTPAIFINGEELLGWQVENGISRAVASLLSGRLEPGTHQADRPPGALEKCVRDWADPENAPREIPEDRPDWALGSGGASVTVTLFGDLQEPVTAEADGIIRSWLAGSDDGRYVFRHFPLDANCNPYTQLTLTPNSCSAAACVESAVRLFGSAAAWRMQGWMLQHPDRLSNEGLRAAAQALEMDVERLIDERDHPDVTAALRLDLEAARQAGVDEIPSLFINGKRVLRWRWEGLDVGAEILGGILDAAALRD